MDGEKLKEYLHKVAETVDKETRLEDIYDQLALLSDIDQSEEEIEMGEVISHENLVEKSREWLK